MTQQLDVIINGKISRKRFITTEQKYIKALESLRVLYPTGIFQAFSDNFGTVYIYMVQ